MSIGDASPARADRLTTPWLPESKLNVWLAVLLGLCIVRFWITPLPSSFWLDEMGTAFVVQHGAADPSLQVVPQVAASIYYVLPALAQRFFGLSEIAYRVPSLVAMGIALFIIGRISARVIHPDAGWFAVFACLVLRDFNFEAADARPYGLATCLIAAGLWFLIRWLNGARWSDAFLFTASAALVWRVHLILWPIYIFFAIYAVARLLRRDTAVRWWQVTLVFALTGVLLIPVFLKAVEVYRDVQAHVIIGLPSEEDLQRALKLDLIVPLLGVAALLARWLRWSRVQRIATADGWTLILGWWLVQPLSLYAFSKLTGHSVFVPRYLSVALPGAALMAVAAAAAFIPANQWKRAALLLGLVLLVFMGRWNRILLDHGVTDWRAAAHRLAVESSGAQIPVICPSPFVEAKSPVWRPGYPIASFLYSHLLVYRTPGKLYAFPYEPSPEGEKFAADLAGGALADAGRFFIYGGDGSVKFWREWFSRRPEFVTWRARRVFLYGEVELDEFAKTD